MHSARSRRPWPALPGLLLLLSACGGSGTSGGKPPANDDSGFASGTDPYPNLLLNDLQTGRVFETDESRYIDLETGETVQLGANAVYPGEDGRYFVEHRESARFVRGGGCGGYSKWFDRISIRDSVSGRIADEFELSESVYGPIRLSPDGQTLALVWDKSHLCNDSDASLTLLSRQGEEIARTLEGGGSYDWLPDNRLVFTLGQKIVMQVERSNFTHETIADLSDLPGYPARVNASPDGTQILFEMVTKTGFWVTNIDYRNATVWAVNVDGTNLRQVATSSRIDDPDSDYDDPQVNMPVWSPDGQSLLLTEDYTSGLPGWVLYNDNVNVVNNVDAIPVVRDALTYILPAASVEQALPPAQYSRFGVRPILSLGSGNRLGMVTVDPLVPVMWAPSYPRPEVLAGSLPPPDGRPNRGVPGSMTFLAENDDGTMSLVSVELATSTPRTLTTFTDPDLYLSSYTTVAADKSRTAHYVYADDALRIFDSAGELLRDVALITNRYHYDPESAFRFSPADNNLIAWIYDDDDFGTGAIVLNMATGIFVGNWEDLDYDAIAWTADGDLLLFDEGQAYRSAVEGANAGDFAEPEKLFDFGEAISQPSVNPVTGDVALVAAGQIFVISEDGQNARRVIASSDGSSHKPQWSADGKFISVLHEDATYVVAADAQDVRLYTDNRSMGGFQLGEGSAFGQPDDSLPLGWHGN